MEGVGGIRLPGLSTHFFRKHGRGGILPLVAVVCLILLTLLAVAQATHLHSNQTDADRCPLCIVMHSVAPAAIAAAAIVFVQLGASTPQAEPIAQTRQPQFRLFIRPPPASR